MVQEMAPDIFRIGVILPDNPLKELNSYYIRGEKKDLLIDTGFRCDACRDALETGLRELGADRKRLEVFVTHLHSDHAGLSDLVGGSGRPVYMSHTDMEYARRFMEGDIYRKTDERYIMEGFSREELDYISSHNPARQYMLPAITGNFVPVGEGDWICVGKHALQVLSVPGHTPGNVMLWEEMRGIMFTGDHVLFDITPNITCWTDVEDSLGNYLENLKRVQDYPVRLALPGHRHGGNFRTRVQSLLKHHHSRLEETGRIIKEFPGSTAYEIAGKMSWRIRARNWDSFPLVQKWFAVGECMAHLDYMRKRGGALRELRDGKYRYWRV